jgi:type I restriction enzyme S subunit
MGFGATVAHIKVGDAENLAIPCPALDIQIQVGNTLANYDDLIETNRRRIALLEESARLLYREWFVKLRFPGHELVEKVDGVPAGWKPGYLFDFVRVLSGGTPNTKTEHFWDGGIPFFTPKDCGNASYVLETEKTLTEAGLNSCNSQLFPKETIFVTARGTVGKLALAQQPMAMNQSCYALAARGHMHNLFLFLAVESAVALMKQMASGGVFDTIVVDTFKRIPFLCPPDDRTALFGKAVRPIFNQIENLLLQNNQLQQARDALLPKLMSGQLTV